MNNHQRNRFATRLLSALMVLFGSITIKAGGSVLFLAPTREAAGLYVPFVLWFNFLAGFLYVAAGLGIWSQQIWAARLSVAIASLTVVVFMAFGLHILSGGLYELRTVGAMTLRSSVWIGIAIWQKPLLEAQQVH